MSAWRRVASLDDLRRRHTVVARVGGRELGVLIDSDGGLHALRNRCPHYGAPLCRGRLVVRREGDPGRYALGEERVLRCPWHGWEFDVETGRCPEDARMRVAVYPVRVVEGEVEVYA